MSDAAQAADPLEVLCCTSGDLDVAERAGEEALAYAGEAHIRLMEAAIRELLAAVALLRCDFDRFDALAAELSSGNTSGIAQQLTTRGEMAGDREGALASMPAPEAAGGNPTFLAWLHGCRARAFFNAGEERAAREELGRCIEMSEAATRGDGRIPLWIEATAELDECLPALGDDALAGRAYESLTGLMSEAKAGRFGRGLDHVRGALALRLDLVGEAGEHYREGLEWAERERCLVEAGRCRQGLDEVAVRRGETAEAMRHLDAAAELFHRHGAKLYLDQVIAKKLELQGGAGSTDSRATIDVPTESIGAERPDLASQVAPDGTVTILFSDIEGSTAFNVELGDDRWMELLGEHNRLVRTAIAEHRGYEVKTEGDAFMVASQSARDALRD